jgi:mono/diheme cytochrome c family protein
MDSRATFMKGGDSGPAVVVGKSAESYLIELVAGLDPDSVMPKKGSKLKPEQIGALRAWIDQGLKWDTGVTFGKLEPINLKPKRPELPAECKDENPIDCFLNPYYAAHKIKPPPPVDDRIFARRVYLDVIGLLPLPEDLEKFVAEKSGDKRVRLVQRLLADNRNYAEHWLSFWNDLLRNDYRGTGYIDGGRKQITDWLYSALAKNLPYDQFVAQLINPTPVSEGFTKGIVWRGVVNASQTPQMQAAQSISQVFMGVNLKCASCHDSLINDWTLADAYGLASIYADGPLEMVHCDKPTGKKADLRFIYPELGQIDSKADKPARLKQLAELVTQKQDGRLTRTIVNRFWQKFMGRGLVEPVDDMETPAWNQDLLDWLGEDLAANGYDLKKTIERILTSRAYQLPAVPLNEQDRQDNVFRGPLVRRMTAEQFRDALGALTGIWYSQPAVKINYVDESAIQSVSSPIKGKWIWNEAGAAQAAAPETIYLRKIITLQEMPTEARAFVTCDNVYTLFINGKKVSSGDTWDQPGVADIRAYLVKGENVIAVKAVNEGDQPNPAGFFFFASVWQNHDDRPATVMDFASDSSWTWSAHESDGWQNMGFVAQDWKPTTELGSINTSPWELEHQFNTAMASPPQSGRVRAALVNADPLMVALGRPNREQVMTVRASAATTLQALELTNGRELADLIQRSVAKLVTANPASSRELIQSLYAQALGRKPTAPELQLAQEMVGNPVKHAGVEDLMWALTMLPEFQLIY